MWERACSRIREIKQQFFRIQHFSIAHKKGRFLMKTAFAK